MLRLLTTGTARRWTICSQWSRLAATTSCTASSCSASTPDAGEGQLPSANSQQKKVFSSTIRFRVADSKVTPENLPSADDLAKMIPTLEDLRKQLPSAKEMENKYVFGTSAAQQAAAEKSTASGENKPLWPNCDTPEEIMDEERYGADGEERAAPTSEQVALAWKALAWGTLYALIGVGVLSVVGLKCSGFSSLKELKEHLATREEREREKLQTSAQGNHDSDEDASGPLQHFVLDLTNPSDVPRQIQEIYEAVQRLAEKEASA
jgi:hypothetical protein